MKVFIFAHPVGFPQSEYGGMWVVRAEGHYQAGFLAWKYFDNPDFRVESFQQAALKALSLELVNHGEPMVLDCFLT
jgi:hypothetical protein